ncbi:MAG TPA: SRPBCC family protein [Rhizomicrobium sp.]|nr:SRPBCC family protein [Rhizomicrobium sp.]
MSSQYVYVTYIRTTPQKLWEALTTPEFIKRYWFGMTQESGWVPGAAWTMKFADGRVADAGEILESDPPRRLVIRWRNEFRPELKEEGWSRCVYTLEQDGEVMKLTVTHSIDKEKAKLIEAVSGGWPRVLSSLKSLLETGEGMPGSHNAPKT